MTETTKSLETELRKLPEAFSSSRSPDPSVPSSGFDLAAIQAATGNMAMQGAAREPDLSAWVNRTPDLRRWSAEQLEFKLYEIERWRRSQTSTSPQSKLADTAAAQIRSQLEEVDFARTEANAAIASLEGTTKDDDEPEASTTALPPPSSLSLLKPEEMCQGPCFTDEEIYREYNEAKARYERQSEEEDLNHRVAWIKEAVQNDDSEDILHLFEHADPAERIALQRQLDMDAVIGVLSDFEAVQFGALGPVIAGQDTLNRKRAHYIKHVIDDFAPVAPARAEVFVLYVFTSVHDFDAHAIFAELANQARIYDLLAMPNVKKMLADRGLDASLYAEPEESWTRVFPGIGRGIRHFVKDDRPGKYQWEKGKLPVEYASLLSKMEMEEFEASLTFKNAVLAWFDEITWGVPHGAFDLVRGTAHGIWDIAHGEYEKGGEKLSGAAIVLLTHVTLKAWSGARRAIGRPGPMEITLSAEGKAVMDRMVDRVGTGGIDRAAAYIQQDSRAAALVIEHGEAGVYALLETEGDAVAAANKLPARQPAAPAASAPSPDVVESGPAAASPGGAAAAGGPTLADYFRRAAISIRLRVGEPIVRGVAETNAELMGGPTEVPTLSVGETSRPVSTTSPTPTLASPIPEMPRFLDLSTELQSTAQVAQSTIRIESSGARSTAQASTSAQAAIAEQAAMGFLNPALAVAGANVAVASSQTERSQTTAIRAQTAEVSGYDARLSLGQIGLLAPVGSNIPGPDYVTAAQLPNGDYEIVVVDTKSRVSPTSPFGQVRVTLPPAWRRAIDDAIRRLGLPDPNMEQAIRDAWAQGRVRIARDTVDYSLLGQGILRLDN
jgi:hypothetical protein